MQKYRDSVISLTGTAVVGATVTVSQYSSGIIATLYSSNGFNQIANPLTSDSNGTFSFYAADGRYSLTISGTGITTQTVTDILLADPVTDLLISTGSGLVGHIASGVNAVATTVQGELRKLAPKNWPLSGNQQFELSNDASALNYSNTRAIGVIQQRDTASGANNELIPGFVMQFNSTGDGVVVGATELSTSIWQGQFNYMNKTGDGSAHAYTCIGQLGAVGVGGYNELGGFQGELTNLGSTKGTMSGVEMLLKDSPNGGANNYSTKMQAVVGRIAKYNPTLRQSFNFYATSEGSIAIDAILAGSPNGLHSWQRGIDFQGLIFTQGQSVLSPNNTFLAWLTAGGSAKSIVGVNNADNTIIASTGAGKSVNLTDATFATKLLVDDNATNSVAIWCGGALQRITPGAANSGGAGFRFLIIPN